MTELNRPCGPDLLPFELAHAAQRRQQRRLQRRRARHARQPPRSGGMQAGPADGARGSPTQQIGSHYESRALALLCEAGLEPVARNMRCRFGEIDLVMREGAVLVLVEVRARSGRRFGGAAASITTAKRARLVRAAQMLLGTLRTSNLPACRFDVVAFDREDVTWRTHAFSLEGRPAL